MSNNSLNEVIEFVSQNAVTDEEGYSNEEYKSEYKCHANIQNFNNSEFISAYTTNSKILISFKVRYCNFTKKLIFDIKTYKIKYNNLFYNIISANDLNQQHKYIILKAEVVE